MTNFPFFYNPWPEGSLHGKPQSFWVYYIQVRLMVAISAPHSGLLPKPGSVECSRSGAAPWASCCMEPRTGHDLMGAVPWVPRALGIFGHQWTQEKNSSWCWAQPGPESAEMWLRWGMAEPKENPVPWWELVWMEVTENTVEESRGWRYPQGPDTEVTSQTRNMSAQEFEAFR